VFVGAAAAHPLPQPQGCHDAGCAGAWAHLTLRRKWKVLDTDREKQVAGEEGVGGRSGWGKGVGVTAGGPAWAGCVCANCHSDNSDATKAALTDVRLCTAPAWTLRGSMIWLQPGCCLVCCGGFV
jgi:hypothetical protein